MPFTPRRRTAQGRATSLRDSLRPPSQRLLSNKRTVTTCNSHDSAVSLPFHAVSAEQNHEQIGIELVIPQLDNHISALYIIRSYLQIHCLPCAFILFIPDCVL